MSSPQYTYEELVTRAQCGQHTLRQCLLVIEAMRTHLQIAAAVSEVSIAPDARTGAIGQYMEDFTYIFQVLDMVMPDAERVADLMWEGPSTFDPEDPARPVLELVPCSQALLDGEHAESNTQKALNDVVQHLHLVDLTAQDLED